MAEPTEVNDQITDAVTQSNVKVLGSAPAQAMGTLYQSIAQVQANAAQNATAAQQSVNAMHQAATAAAINLLLGGRGAQP
jgi:hypothetical protein